MYITGLPQHDFDLLHSVRYCMLIDAYVIQDLTGIIRVHCHDQR